MNKLIAIIMITFNAVIVLGQDCYIQLENAQRAYYNGNLNTVITLLEGCVSSNSLDPGEQESALKLLVNAHLILNQDSLANSYMQQLLTINPLTETRSSDLIEYKRLRESYWIRPRQNLGIMVGINYSSLSTLQFRGLGSITQETDQYETSPGITVGIKMDQYLNKNLFISTGLIYNRYAYQTSELLLTYQRSFIEERLDYLSVPALVGVEMPFEQMDVFVSAGISTSMHVSSKGDLELFGIQSEDPITIVPGIPEKGENINLNHQRSAVTFNYQVNAGIRRRFGLLGISLIAQYDFGLNNLVDEEGRFAREEVWKRFSYVPNDFKLDAMKFLISVSKRFSTPNKK